MTLILNERDARNNCLFCFTNITPYNPFNDGEENGGTKEPAVNTVPTFENVCSFLKLKYPRRKSLGVQREGQGEGEGGGDSIFVASCDKFLCLACFEQVNSLSKLYRDLVSIQEKIKSLTGTIKNVIKEHVGFGEGGCDKAGEGDGRSEEGNFAKVFENHVKLVTETSSVWKGENKILDAFLEIKQEVEVQQHPQDHDGHVEEMQPGVEEFALPASMPSFTVTTSAVQSEPLPGTVSVPQYTFIRTLEADSVIHSGHQTDPTVHVSAGGEVVVAGEIIQISSEEMAQLSGQVVQAGDEVVQEVTQEISHEEYAGMEVGSSQEDCHSQTQGVFDQTGDQVQTSSSMDGKTEESEGFQFSEFITPHKSISQIAEEICSRTNDDPKDSVKVVKIEKKRVFECHYCGKIYAALRSLKDHITENHAKTRKKNTRGVLIESKVSLRARSAITVDGKTLFQCPTCQKRYEKVKALRNHIARNHAPGSKDSSQSVVTCSMCSTYRTFKTEELLQRHIFSMHTQGAKFKCKQCNKSFHARQSLNFHVDAEHKGVRYKCCISGCSKYFTHPTQLRQHHKLAHIKEGLLKCPHCEREFVRQCDLNTHIIIHDPNAPKNHVCDICGKEFLHRAGLADHVKTHSNDRKFQCTYCPDKFRKHSHLVAHVRKHTGERPYKCSLCEKSFAVNSTLTQHMKTHVGPPKKRGKKPKPKGEPKQVLKAEITATKSEPESTSTA